MITNDRVTGQDVLNYINRPIGFFSSAGSYGLTVEHQYVDGELIYWCSAAGTQRFIQRSILSSQSNRSRGDVLYRRICDIIKFNHDISKRIVGLVLGENSDGSLHIAILGNENLRFDTEQNSNIDYAHYDISGGLNDLYDIDTETSELTDKELVPFFPTFTNDAPSGEASFRLRQADNVSFDHYVDSANLIDYTPYFNESYAGQKMGSIRETSYHPRYSNNFYQITNNKNDTLQMGKALYTTDQYALLTHGYEWKDPRKNICGDIYNYLYDVWTNILRPITQGVFLQPLTSNYYITPRADTEVFGNTAVAGQENGTQAFDFLPCNIILTADETSALRYLETGTVPADAWLYPVDWENLSRIPAPGDDPTDDDDPGDDIPPDDTRQIDPMVISAPEFSPQSLSNNNLYWLSAGEFESFMRWFWWEAGDIIDLEDLWQAVTGLYSDLGSAIINVKYMPVNKAWIGGTTLTDAVLLGQISHTQSVESLNHAVAPVQTIGSVNIEEIYKDYVTGRFTNYNPYADVSLYLPFHGYLELDTNIFMGKRLTIKAVYDVISGTIQYFIFCDDDWLVNTVVAKMAVDIPITLQSKADTDGAIMQNIGNLGIQLMNPVKTGAGAVGLALGVNSVSSDMQGVPMSVRGTIGESGAFYSDPKCAVMIRRPTFNLPATYKGRLGIVTNGGYKLSDMSGYFECYNPKISFSAGAPLQDEITEIYDLLQGGVIK